MKYDMNVVLNNMDGTESIEDGVAATMRIAITRALVSDNPMNPPTADQKIKRFALFSKIATTPPEEPVDLSVDDLAVVKAAADIWPTLIYGQIVAFLDQRT